MEKQKTAMQQLKERLEVILTPHPLEEPDLYQNGYCEALRDVIKTIDSEMMAIERDIIIDAFDLCSDKMGINGEQYYTQTFEK